jgi:hypothetical protein
MILHKVKHVLHTYFTEDCKGGQHIQMNEVVIFVF